MTMDREDADMSPDTRRTYVKRGLVTMTIVYMLGIASGLLIGLIV